MPPRVIGSMSQSSGGVGEEYSEANVGSAPSDCWPETDFEPSAKAPVAGL